MKFHIDILKAKSTKEVRKGLFQTLAAYRNLLPQTKAAKILLKPNLNSNMNALTGNTTDLRLIAAVIEFLQYNGYEDITIADGTNSGFYRNNISVISRLAVDKLANYYGVKVADLNSSEKVNVAFEDGVSAVVAKDCVDADFLINMPKLKTHFEVGMSVCLKNLMGCLVGQENKKKAHKKLARNIININKMVKPNLHIVDGLIAMEGLGPTRGRPIHTGLIVVGTDPLLVDLACAALAGFDYRSVKTLETLEEDGILTKNYHDFICSLNLGNSTIKFAPPKADLLASFVHSPKRQKYFLAIRNTPFFNYLCSTRLFGSILFKTGLRQDNFLKEEMRLERLTFHRHQCQKGCSRCAEYCPIGLELPDALESDSSNCIGCLYCYMVCPSRAIGFEGTLGFVRDQLRHYDNIIREIT